MGHQLPREVLFYDGTSRNMQLSPAEKITLLLFDKYNPIIQGV